MIDTDKYEGLSEVIDRIINSDEIGVDDLLADSMAIKDGINDLLAEVKRLKSQYNKLKGALYDEWVHRDIEDSCNCEYIIEQKLESGEITMEEAESDTPECQYCIVMGVFENDGDD